MEPELLIPVLLLIRVGVALVLLLLLVVIILVLLLRLMCLHRVLVEPELDGKFTKWNNNAGAVLKARGIRTQVSSPLPFLFSPTPLPFSPLPPRGSGGLYVHALNTRMLRRRKPGSSLKMMKIFSNHSLGLMVRN